MTRHFASFAELEAAVGTELGESRWIEVTQDLIDRFAAVTGDIQWIHTDPGRARQSPYGTTIAHGFLTLALIPPLRDEIFLVDGIGAIINYGLDRLRFIEPVPSGSRIRLRLKLLSVTPARRGRRLLLEATVERQGAPRPALAAELIALLLPA